MMMLLDEIHHRMLPLDSAFHCHTVAVEGAVKGEVEEAVGAVGAMEEGSEGEVERAAAMEKAVVEVAGLECLLSPEEPAHWLGCSNLPQSEPHAVRLLKTLWR